VRAVVDTNVVAFHLLGTEPFAREAGEFWRTVGQCLAPASWAAELANVVWMAVRTGVISKTEGVRRLRFAGRLSVHSVSIRTLWQGALTRAVETNLAVYDTLFVELAARQGVPLITFDKRLLRAAPTVARRPADFPGH
jgi:predicted nucleic acid-binding protein